MKFDNFEKNDEYVPPLPKEAQNVPKPLVPANMNKDNVDGMYAFIGYLAGELNYALMTGDTEPMKKADPAECMRRVCGNLRSCTRAIWAGSTVRIPRLLLSSLVVLPTEGVR